MNAVTILLLISSDHSAHVSECADIFSLLLMHCYIVLSLYTLETEELI